jgi:type IV pilus assembly protein PilY1
VGTQNFGFDSNKGLTSAEYSSYDTFLATKASRTPVLYVGANDGMLHAINANSGAELFTYVPRAVYPALSALSDPLYTHAFYVDGSPTSVDAFVSSAWKTLLVATTGAGGHDVFLLDVTSPTSETASNVMWDYDGVDGTTSVYTEPANTHTTVKSTSPDPDMGYTINEPTIVRMHDGDWYALFGNGYSSTNQQAVIYLYNINTNVLYKYSTSTGSSTAPNGMSSPSPVDLDGDRITDAIYAGDLLGNLWKLDVSSNSPSNWKFTTYGNSVPTPLFTAHDSSSNVQPITDRPQVGLDSSGRLMVYFGTGTYFLTGDNAVPTNPPVQSFYGIIDDKGNASTDQVKGTSGTDRSELRQQLILASTTILGNTFRITSTNAMTSSDKGWFMDLVPYSGSTQGTAVGERVVSDAVLDLGRIVFPTVIPQGNACQFGGESFLMELDASSGAALSSSPLDTNGDGKVNNQDLVTVTYIDPTTNQSVTKTVAVSGQQSNIGIIKTPAIISAGLVQKKIIIGSTGNHAVITEKGGNSSGRLSWQQLQ